MIEKNLGQAEILPQKRRNPVSALRQAMAILFVAAIAATGSACQTPPANTCPEAAKEKREPFTSAESREKIQKIKELIQQISKKYKDAPAMVEQLHLTEKLEYLLSTDFTRDCKQAGLEPQAIGQKLFDEFLADAGEIMTKNPANYIAKQNEKRRLFHTVSELINQLIAQHEKERGVKLVKKGVVSEVDECIHEGNMLTLALLLNQVEFAVMPKKIEGFGKQAQEAIEKSNARLSTLSAR